MAWIKRNLLFVIGTVIALALMGVAGFYLYSKWQANNTVWETLNADYAELKLLSEAKPHPGQGKVDNIKAAREQEQELRTFLQKARGGFVRIPPVPDMPKPSDRDFSSALSSTIDMLRREATNSSVALVADYAFSFQAQKQKMSFAAGSLEPLSVQLGEVKAICAALFAAKINALDGIRRERVSTDDNAGQLTDYLADKTTTNELALLTPYEVTFRCFTPELASVLSGLATSPHSIILKTINVEAAPQTTPDLAAQPVTPLPMTYAPPVIAPQPGRAEADAAFRNRYGMDAGGGFKRPPLSQPVPVPVPVPVPTTPGAPAGPVGKGGLPVVLDEKQLKVTAMLVVVKLIPPKNTPQN